MHEPSAEPRAIRFGWLRLAPLGLAWLVAGTAFLKAFDVVIPSDPSNYVVEARKILDLGLSHLLSGDSRTAPGFPLILAGAIRVGGLFAPYVVNLVFCLALLAAAWAWFRRLFPPGPAAVCLAALCGLLFASTPVAVTYMIHPFREPSTLACCFAALALLTRRAGDAPARWREPLAALLLMAGAGIRETVLLLLPGIAAWVLFHPVGARAERFRRLGGFLLPWCVVGLVGLAVVLTRGAWSNQSGQVVRNLLNYAGSEDGAGGRMAAHWPEFLGYARGMAGVWLWLALPGAVLACVRGRLWLVTWAILLPQAALVLLVDIFPRYVIFVLVWAVPFAGASAQVLTTRAVRRFPLLTHPALSGGLGAALMAVALIPLIRLPDGDGFTRMRETRFLRDQVHAATVEGVPTVFDPFERAVHTLRLTHLDMDWRSHRPDSWWFEPAAQSRTGFASPDRLHLVFHGEARMLFVGGVGEQSPVLTRFRENRRIDAWTETAPAPSLARLWRLDASWTNRVEVQLTPPPGAAGENLVWLQAGRRGGSGPDADGSRLQLDFPAGDPGAPADGFAVDGLPGRPSWFILAVPEAVRGGTLALHAKQSLLVPRPPRLEWISPGEWKKMPTGVSFATDAMLFTEDGAFDEEQWLAAGGATRFVWPKLELNLPGVLGWTNGVLGVSLLCSSSKTYRENGNFWCEWDGQKIPANVGRGPPDIRHAVNLRLTWRLPVGEMTPAIPVRLFTDNGQMDRMPLRVRRIDVNWSRPDSRPQ